MLLAKEKAQELIQKYQTADPFTLCEILGILIIKAELPESVRGFSLGIKGKRIVYLNENLEDPMMKQVCAHELGHIVLHPQHNLIFMMEHTLYVHERFEREADQFCAALLISQSQLKEVSTVQELAAIAGVEERIAVMRVEMER